MRKGMTPAYPNVRKRYSDSRCRERYGRIYPLASLFTMKDAVLETVCLHRRYYRDL